jgi:hypothetical protein
MVIERSFDSIEAAAIALADNKSSLKENFVK